YNSYDVVFEAWKQIALVFKDNEYKELLGIMTMVGFAASGLGSFGKAAMTGNSGSIFITWIFPPLIGAALTYTFITSPLAPRVTLVIYDTVTGATGSVGELPEILVMVATTLNKIESGMIDIVSTSSAPSMTDYKSQAGGIGFEVIRRTANSSVSNLSTQTNKKRNIHTYLDKCIVSTVMSNPAQTFDMSVLLNGNYTQAMSELSKGSNPADSTLIYTNPGFPAGQTKTCKEAFDIIDTDIGTVAKAKTFLATSQDTICRMNGWVGNSPSCSDKGDAVLSDAMGGSATMAEVMAQKNLAESLNAVILGTSAEAAVTAMASRSAGSSMLASGMVANQWIPIIKGVVTATAIALMPFLIIFLPTPVFPKVIATIVGFFVWIAAWGVCDAIVHNFAYTLGKKTFGFVQAGGISYSSISNFETAAEKTLAVLGALRWSGLMLATVITQMFMKFGGTALASLAGGLTSSPASAGGSAGSVLTPEGKISASSSLEHSSASWGNRMRTSSNQRINTMQYAEGSSQQAQIATMENLGFDTNQSLIPQSMSSKAPSMGASDSSLSSKSSGLLPNESSSSKGGSQADGKLPGKALPPSAAATASSQAPQASGDVPGSGAAEPSDKTMDSKGDKDKDAPQDKSMEGKGSNSPLWNKSSSLTSLSGGKASGGSATSSSSGGWGSTSLGSASADEVSASIKDGTMTSGASAMDSMDKMIRMTAEPQGAMQAGQIKGNYNAFVSNAKSKGMSSEGNTDALRTEQAMQEMGFGTAGAQNLEGKSDSSLKQMGAKAFTKDAASLATSATAANTQIAAESQLAKGGALASLAAGTGNSISDLAQFDGKNQAGQTVGKIAGEKGAAAEKGEKGWSPEHFGMLQGAKSAVGSIASGTAAEAALDMKVKPGNVSMDKAGFEAAVKNVSNIGTGQGTLEAQSMQAAPANAVSQLANTKAGSDAIDKRMSEMAGLPGMADKTESERRSAAISSLAGDIGKKGTEMEGIRSSDGGQSSLKNTATGAGITAGGAAFGAGAGTMDAIGEGTGPLSQSVQAASVKGFGSSAGAIKDGVKTMTGAPDVKAAVEKQEAIKAKAAENLKTLQSGGDITISGGASKEARAEAVASAEKAAATAPGATQDKAKVAGIAAGMKYDAEHADKTVNAKSLMADALPSKLAEHRATAVHNAEQGAIRDKATDGGKLAGEIAGKKFDLEHQEGSAAKKAIDDSTAKNFSTSGAMEGAAAAAAQSSVKDVKPGPAMNSSEVGRMLANSQSTLSARNSLESIAQGQNLESGLKGKETSLGTFAAGSGSIKAQTDIGSTMGQLKGEKAAQSAYGMDNNIQNTVETNANVSFANQAGSARGAQQYGSVSENQGSSLNKDLMRTTGFAFGQNIAKAKGSMNGMDTMGVSSDNMETMSNFAQSQSHLATTADVAKAQMSRTTQNRAEMSDQRLGEASAGSMSLNLNAKEASAIRGVISKAGIVTASIGADGKFSNISNQAAESNTQTSQQGDSESNARMTKEQATAMAGTLRSLAAKAPAQEKARYNEMAAKLEKNGEGMSFSMSSGVGRGQDFATASFTGGGSASMESHVNVGRTATNTASLGNSSSTAKDDHSFSGWKSGGKDANGKPLPRVYSSGKTAGVGSTQITQGSETDEGIVSQTSITEVDGWNGAKNAAITTGNKAFKIDSKGVMREVASAQDTKNVDTQSVTSPDGTSHLQKVSSGGPNGGQRLTQLSSNSVVNKMERQLLNIDKATNDTNVLHGLAGDNDTSFGSALQNPYSQALFSMAGGVNAAEGFMGSAVGLMGAPMRMNSAMGGVKGAAGGAGGGAAGVAGAAGPRSMWRKAADFINKPINSGAQASAAAGISAVAIAGTGAALAAQMAPSHGAPTPPNQPSSPGVPPAAPTAPAGGAAPAATAPKGGTAPAATAPAGGAAPAATAPAAAATAPAGGAAPAAAKKSKNSKPSKSKASSPNNQDSSASSRDNETGGSSTKAEDGKDGKLISPPGKKGKDGEDITTEGNDGQDGATPEKPSSSSKKSSGKASKSSGKGGTSVSVDNAGGVTTHTERGDQSLFDKVDSSLPPSTKSPTPGKSSSKSGSGSGPEPQREEQKLPEVASAPGAAGATPSAPVQVASAAPSA
ncbi:MAG: conjugal transfer protein TraG N-terminal domain-containing protein, partial [Desulfuromonadaceae bacterium]